MPRRLPSYESQVSVRGGDRGAISSAQPVQSSLGIGISLSKDLTSAAFEITKQRDTARMIKQISDINIATTERMAELSLTGTGDRPFAEVAVQDFVSMANDFIAQQPAYLRDDAREKMMGMKDRVAGQAIAMQAQIAAQELARETEELNNSLSNQVILGQLGQQDALAVANAYVDALPAMVQKDARKELTENINMAYFSNLVEKNPNAALKQLGAEQYRTMDSRKISAIKSAAERKIESLKNQAIAAEAKRLKIQNEILQKRFTDPAGSAEMALITSGVDPASITPDMLLDAQSSLGVHPDNQSLLSQNTVNNMWLAMGPSVENTVDGAWSFVQNISQTYQNQDHAKIAVNDFIRHADAPQELKSVMAEYILSNGQKDIVSETTKQNIEYQLRTLGRDKEVSNAFSAKFGDKAKKENDKINTAIMEKIGTPAFRAGVNVESINGTRDILERVYKQARIDGYTDTQATQLALGKYADMSAVGDSKSLLLPNDIAQSWTSKIKFGGSVRHEAGGFSSKSLDRELVDIAISRDIQSKTLVVPPNVAEEQFYGDTSRFDWVNGVGLKDGKEYIRMVYKGAGGGLSPVIRLRPNGDRQEVIVTMDQLRILVGQ